VAGLTYLSPNTVKSDIRTIYRKIDVAGRTQAVLWGVSNGFSPGPAPATAAPAPWNLSRRPVPAAVLTVGDRGFEPRTSSV